MDCRCEFWQFNIWVLCQKCSVVDNFNQTIPNLPFWVKACFKPSSHPIILTIHKFEFFIEFTQNLKSIFRVYIMCKVSNHRNTDWNHPPLQSLYKHQQKSPAKLLLINMKQNKGIEISEILVRKEVHKVLLYLK